jgi:hypothetical protein
MLFGDDLACRTSAAGRRNGWPFWQSAVVLSGVKAEGDHRHYVEREQHCCDYKTHYKIVCRVPFLLHGILLAVMAPVLVTETNKASEAG